jgi:predicted SnoaL-like aldol condensation-catalyzing enzyme
MKRKFAVRTFATWPGILLALAAGWVPVAAQDNPALEGKNQKLVMDWYREVIVFAHVDLAAKYMADTYVEHDPNVTGGRKEFVAYHGKTPARPIQAALPNRPVQVFAKGDYVVLAWEHSDNDPKTNSPYKFTTYDVVRVKDGKIQEHWNSLKKNP